MKNKDYMVVSPTTDEEIYDTLKEARARAKDLSKELYNDSSLNSNDKQAYI